MPLPPETVKKVIPLLGPLLATLQSRKGLFLWGAYLFIGFVYWRDPSQLDKLLVFLGATLTAYMAATAYEDKAKMEADAKVVAATMQSNGPTTNVLNTTNVVEAKPDAEKTLVP